MDGNLQRREYKGLYIRAKKKVNDKFGREKNEYVNANRKLL